jgi:PAS domain S-box-containing protein
MTKNNNEKEVIVFTDDEKSKNKAAFAQASIEKAEEAVFWIDKNARFVDVNQAGCRHLGYDKDELLSLTVFDTDPNIPKEGWPDHWEELKEKGSLSFETLHRHKSGRIFPAEVRLNYIKLADKEYNFAFAQDITERKQSEDVLKEAEIKYRNIIENASFGISTYSESGQCIVANEALADIIGATVEEVLSQNFYRIKSWQQSGMLDAAKKSLETMEKERRTVHIVTTFGKEIWLDCVFLPYYESDKKFMMFLAEDVTLQKEAEEELHRAKNELELKVQERTRDLKKANEELLIEIENHKETEKNLIENEKRFRAAATTTADLIWEGDVRVDILRWHGDIDTILGYEQNEFPRTVSGHMDNIHPDDRDNFTKAVEKAIETGEDFYEEYRMKCKNGDYRYWDERGRAIGFENGSAVKWVGSVTDITERRLSLELLKKSEDKFKKLSNEFNTLLDAIPDSLVLLSPDLKILWSNRAFESQLANECSECKGNHCYQLCCDRTSPCENCPVIKSFRSGKEESTHVMASDGKILDKRAFPMLDKSGNVINVIEVSRDITARVRMEEEARLVQSRLIHANKMTSLGTLVSGVAHEINNPNSFIMSNAQVFSEIWNDAVKILKENHNGKNNIVLGGIPFDELIQLAPRLLGGINDGSVRINKIIQSLKNFARPDKSSLDGKVDIKNVIMSSRTILDNHINKFTNNFHLDIETNIPVIKGSSQQIEQVIINLIMNALQALNDREAEILISASFDKAHNDVVIKVKDEGRGMSDDIIQSVTKPFFTTRIEDGGTGLGLSISYAIIKDHNGILGFESESGLGTTVTVSLPANK